MLLFLLALSPLFSQSSDDAVAFGSMPSVSAVTMMPPRWNGAVVLRSVDKRTGTFSVEMIPAGGRRIPLDLSLPGDPIVEVFDACATDLGFAVTSALIETTSGRRAYALLLFDAQGNRKAIVRTNPFRVKHVAAAKDGSFWVFGQNESQNGSAIADHKMLYHFALDGKLIETHGLASELRLPPYPLPFANFTGASSMAISDSSIFVYLNRLKGTLLEFNLDGTFRRKSSVPSPFGLEDSDPSQLRTFSTDGLGNPLAVFTGPQETGVYILRPPQNLWVRSEELSKVYGRILGRDGDKLVLMRPLSNGAEWQFLRF